MPPSTSRLLRVLATAGTLLALAAPTAHAGTLEFLQVPDLGPTSASGGSTGGPVYIKNTGSETTLTAVGLSGPHASDFGADVTYDCGSGTLPIVLAAGELCGVNLRFDPSAGGLRTATMTFTSTATNPSFDVPVSGTATDPNIAISATSLTFDPLQIATGSASATVTITNMGGTEALWIEDWNHTSADFRASIGSCTGWSAFTGCPSPPPACMRIPIDGSCTLTVTFDPTNTGTRSASLVYRTNDVDLRDLTLALTGTGVAGAVTAPVRRLDFGTVRLGTKVTKQVTFTSSGSVDLLEPRVALSESDRGFAITPGDGCGASTWPVGSTCTVAVTFAPTVNGGVSNAMWASAPGSPLAHIDLSADTCSMVRSSGCPGRDRWIGTTRLDRAWGGDGNDLLDGRAGNDVLSGGGGNDTVNGNLGNDTLRGSTGNDRMIGGRGRDRIYGESGTDTIVARDRTRDIIDCGAGRDIAVVDRIDIVRSCEVVRRR